MPVPAGVYPSEVKAKELERRLDLTSRQQHEQGSGNRGVPTLVEDFVNGGRKAFSHVQMRVRKKWVGEFVSGAISGALTKTATAPLETLRTRLIVDSNHGIVSLTQDILKKQGWRGLFAGNGINVLRITPSHAIELATFEGIKRFISAVERRQKEEYGDDCLRVRVLGRTVKLPPVNPSGVAGAAAGVMCTLACYPLEVLKDRFTIDPGAHNADLVLAVRRIVREEGAGVLYRGLTPTLVGMVPYSAAYFYLYDSFKTRYRLAGRQHLDTPETLVIGGLAGVAASWSTYPLEVARKRIMVGSLGGTRKVYKNMIDALVSIAREEGLQGLYRGLGPSTLKVMPASGLSWALYEACKSILKVDTGL